MTKRDQTRRTLELALRRIDVGRPKTIAKNRKLSIAALAEEAGVTPAAIHNYYPDIAERVRALVGKDTRTQRNRKHRELQGAKVTIGELRDEIKALERDLKKLASENARLLTENRELQAIVQSENVVMIQPKS